MLRDKYLLIMGRRYAKCAFSEMHYRRSLACKLVLGCDAVELIRGEKKPLILPIMRTCTWG